MEDDSVEEVECLLKCCSKLKKKKVYYFSSMDKKFPLVCYSGLQNC